MTQQSEQAVVMNIPQETVSTLVKAAVAQVLAKDPQKLVAAVVEHALKQSGRNYGKTVFDEQIEAMILAVATEAAKEWMKEQAPKIRAAVRTRFDADKSKLISKLCDQVVDCLANNLSINISIRDRS